LAQNETERDISRNNETKRERAMQKRIIRQIEIEGDNTNKHKLKERKRKNGANSEQTGNISRQTETASHKKYQTPLDTRDTKKNGAARGR